MKLVDTLMETWARPLAPVLEAPWFMPAFNLVMFINPIALLPQVFAIIAAPSAEGLSVTTWWITIFLQVITALFGLKTKNAGLFFAMLLSIVEVTIIIAFYYSK